MKEAPSISPAAGAIALERVHHLFEAQVVRTPEVCAVRMENEGALTYRELDRRANRFAHYLRGLGVSPEVIVGICLERSIGGIISLLAVLKAGGAYLPLDPAYPTERLAYMLANARAPLLITEPDAWPSGDTPDCKRVSYQEYTSSIAAEDVSEADDVPVADLAGPSVDPLAYVIYTSGSTGKPKGVAVAHASLCNLMRWHAEEFTLPVGARVIQSTPLSFDVSVQEVFATLTAGGTLVLIEGCLRRDPRGMRQFLAAECINRFFLTPVMLYQIAELPGPPLPDLCDVIAAGEQLRITPAVVRFFTEGTSARLHNQYGPTETTVISHSYTLPNSPASWPLLPPLGPALGRLTNVFTVDEAGQPLPAGQAGELYFGGPCVSRGYLYDPEKTRDKFIPHPTDPDAGRVYRSGDLAQQTPDGCWHFLGRVDGQVKIRGYRVELGEIESILGEHPAIAQTAVAASEPGPGGDRDLLAGYLLRPGVPVPDEAGLRGWLAGRLPEQFMPARLVALESFPMTPSGKLDRRALAEACRTQADAAPPLPPGLLPRTPMEAAITGIWQEILGRTRVSVEQNFFEAGGNSIAAVRAHNRICEQTGRDYPIATFFQYPTIRTLAAHLTGNKTVPTGGNMCTPVFDATRERARRQQAATQARPPTRPVVRR